MNTGTLVTKRVSGGVPLQRCHHQVHRAVVVMVVVVGAAAFSRHEGINTALLLSVRL